MKRVVSLMLTLAIVAGCKSKAGTGAVIGGIGGAAVGGLIGSKSHARAGEGAAIGAAVGALGGAAVGHSQDKKDERERKQNDAYNRPAAQPAASTAVSRADVIEWSQTSVSDDVIIDRIQRSGSHFVLTDADVKELRQARVSERVINAMKATNG